MDKIDFLVGQTGNRSYEEGQRAPGDWEALGSQRPIAVHALENPGRSDVGVYLCRKLLREQVRALQPVLPDSPVTQGPKDSLPMYSQDSILNLPQREGEDDRLLVMNTGTQVLAIMREADLLPSEKRDEHVRRRLDQLDGGAR